MTAVFKLHYFPFSSYKWILIEHITAVEIVTLNKVYMIHPLRDLMSSRQKLMK